MATFHGTTILAVRKNGRVALGGDGQVSMGETVMKSQATKVRTLKGGKVLAGFAGSVADALTLYEKFEEKLDRHPGNLPRAAVEMRHLLLIGAISAAPCGMRPTPASGFSPVRCCGPRCRRE